MECILSFLTYLEFEKRYSKRTVKAYHIDLLQFHDYCISLESEPLRANSKVIRNWVVYLLESDCSNRSVNRKISTLKSFYKFLLRRELIEVNPLVKIESLKNVKSLPAFITEPQANLLLDEVSFGSDFSGVRNKLVIDLFYNTGIRLSELINLKEKDIDQANQTIKVLGKRNKERIIPITSDLVLAINNYCNQRLQITTINPDGYLFLTIKGSKLYPELVYRLVRTALATVTTQQKRSPHILRHTFATHLLNNGAEISAIKELLGHTSLAATQVYTHNSFEKLKKIYKQAHPRA